MKRLIKVNEPIQSEISTTLYLWPGQALYIGAGEGITSTLHQHSAAQIGLSLGAPFRLKYKDEREFEERQSFVIAPNTPHQVEATGGPAIFVWIEAKKVISRFGLYGNDRELEPVRQVSPAISTTLLPLLQTALNAQLSRTEATNLVERIVEAVADSKNQPVMLPDPRIHSALEIMNSTYYLELAQPVEFLAQAVHLSPSRLRHLFKRQLGLSIQRYLLWQRLLTALQNCAQGHSLTWAAYEAGFADLAHLTRVFRHSFGLKPSEILKNSHSVQVIAFPD
jgi:AraC family transcriptional regulator